MVKIEYIAGLFDGEGCVTFLYSKRKSGNLCIAPLMSIVNQNKEVLEEVKKFFNFGNIYGPRKDSKCFEYANRNLGDCLVFAHSLLPYLIIKKERTKQFIEICIDRLRQLEKNYHGKYPPEFIKKVRVFRGESPL